MNSSEWPGEAHIDDRWGELYTCNIRADIVLDQHSDVVIVFFGLMYSSLPIQGQSLRNCPRNLCVRNTLGVAVEGYTTANHRALVSTRLNTLS